jgi:hypothetical protein
VSFSDDVKELSPLYADRILAIVRLSQNGVRDVDEYAAIDPRVEGIRRFVDSCYHIRPRDIALAAIDAVLETCGVEGFTADFRGDNAVNYANTGDSYVATVCLVTVDGVTSWRVVSYAELIEMFERHGVSFG